MLYGVSMGAASVMMSLDKDLPKNDLIDLVKIIAPYLIKQHCESDAIDLLIEVDCINDIKDFINENNYKKICLYLLRIP